MFLLLAHSLTELTVRQLQFFQRAAQHILGTLHGIFAILTGGTHNIFGALFSGSYQFCSLLTGFYGDYEIALGNEAEVRRFYKENTGYYNVTKGPMEQRIIL